MCRWLPRRKPRPVAKQRLNVSSMPMKDTKTDWLGTCSSASVVSGTLLAGGCVLAGGGGGLSGHEHQRAEILRFAWR